jgi:hypothetical protein
MCRKGFRSSGHATIKPSSLRRRVSVWEVLLKFSAKLQSWSFARGGRGLGSLG